MGIRLERGFTILEVMLFLAISGGLLAALIVGVNVNINQERYKDSVNNFLASIQKQYVLATNITSTRSEKWKCGAQLEEDTGADTTRGTTECSIVGRLIQGSDDGSTITVSNVVAYNINDNALPTATSDIDALTNDMTLKAMSQTDSTDSNDWQKIDMGWGSTFKRVRDGVTGDGNFTLAIIRSPLTGTVATYVADEVTDDWKGKIITAANTTRGVTLCVSSPSFIAMPNLAVSVAGASVSTAGVSRSSGVDGC